MGFLRFRYSKILPLEGKARRMVKWLSFHVGEKNHGSCIRLFRIYAVVCTSMR